MLISSSGRGVQWPFALQLAGGSGNVITRAAAISTSMRFQGVALARIIRNPSFFFLNKKNKKKHYIAENPVQVKHPIQVRSSKLYL